MKLLSIKMQACPPFLSWLEPTNALEAYTMPQHVLCLLTFARFSKVLATVIKTITIAVVASFAAYNLVHSDDSTTVPASGVVCVFAFQDAPIPLSEPFKVGSIYESVLSFGQRNQAVRWVLRLGDFVSTNTIFLHRSSLKDRLLPAALYQREASCH